MCEEDSQIISLKDLLNRPIQEVTFDIKSYAELDLIKEYLNKNGETLINIKLSNNEDNFNFRLKNKRSLDRKLINVLRNKEISAIIS